MQNWSSSQFNSFLLNTYLTQCHDETTAVNNWNEVTLVWCKVWLWTLLDMDLKILKDNLVKKTLRNGHPRITKWLMLEETSESHLDQRFFSSSATWREQSDTMSRQLLNISMGGDSTTESQDCFSWNRLLWSSSPTVHPSLPGHH